tara:strand:- start:773 stop:2863 length:2091 start_codon:yes stop_codon:yes gene_type:complete
MKDYKTENIINFSLVGHSASGKTILSESMLFNAGQINRMGTIENGNTVSDYQQNEVKDQHSVSLSLMNMEWKDKKFNVMDTPGYLDFQGESKCALKVSDFAAVVVSGVNGVEVGTQLMWEMADENNLPKAVVINLMDRDNSNFDDVLAAAKTQFGNKVFPVMVPVDSGENFSQIGDVLRKNKLTFQTDGSGKFSEGEADGDLSGTLDGLHNELIELIAESDDSLLETFFEQGELSEEQMRSGLHSAIASGGLIPVFCISARNNIGVQRMMDFISKYAPCASDTMQVKGMKPGSEDEISSGCSVSDKTTAMVFKTINEAHIGEFSFFRVFGGTLKNGDILENTSRNNKENIRQVFTMQGKNRKDQNQIIAGDIGAAVKLKNTHTGDTLAASGHAFVVKPIQYPEPNMRLAVMPKSRGDEEKMAEGLSVIHEEDPTFVYNFDSELKQTIISGQGELHLTTMMHKIQERYNVELVTEPPKVPYRETITANAESKYRHKKQSGGSGQFAEVWMRIGPAGRGEGVDFKESLTGQNVDRSFVSSVEKGVKALCQDGIIAGCKVVDLKVDFYDGKMHPVDSNDMAFQLAGKKAFQEAFEGAKPKILEPIYTIQVKVPDDVMGDVMGDISSRRGRVQGMDAEGQFQVINAEVPLAMIHDYSTALRAMSSGRGIYTQKFSHYEDMPQGEANKVIAAYKESRQQGE